MCRRTEGTGADSVDEVLPLGGHHAPPAPRAHARTDDDAFRLDLDIALYREGKLVSGGRLLRPVRFLVRHIRRVVMVPGRIPGHMGDSVIPHGETIPPNESQPACASVRLRSTTQCLPTDGLSLRTERCLAVTRRRVLAISTSRPPH